MQPINKTLYLFMHVMFVWITRVRKTKQIIRQVFLTQNRMFLHVRILLEPVKPMLCLYSIFGQRNSCTINYKTLL